MVNLVLLLLLLVNMYIHQKKLHSEIDALKHYYFVGGMPEAVQSFAEEKDFNEVSEIQKRILEAYEQDFSKHDVYLYVHMKI